MKQFASKKGRKMRKKNLFTNFLVLLSKKTSFLGLEKKLPTYRSFRAGDVLHSQADISKAIQLIEYVPEYNIAEGLDKTIDWYISSLR